MSTTNFEFYFNLKTKNKTNLDTKRVFLILDAHLFSKAKIFSATSFEANCLLLDQLNETSKVSSNKKMSTLTNFYVVETS